MIPDEIIYDLRSLEPQSFVARHIFDRVPFAFGTDQAGYLDWRSLAAVQLGVDPAELTIVGSAAIGLSLNPQKNFKLFDMKSDIDIAVVSPYHFQVAWRFFRRNSTLRARLNNKERAAWDDHRQRLIYWGAVATDRLLARLPFGREWRTALDNIENASPTSNAVNVRIYNDYDSLRQYQINSVRLRRDEILTAEF